MECERYVSFVMVILMGFLWSSEAHLNFFVGGKDGWVLKPCESYSHWAERNRFQVNDSLVFKYKNGSDSVLVVNKDDYYKCSKANPIQTLEDGDSVFKFDRSGPFFFISGHGDNCQKGQKLIVVVLAVRNTTRHETPSPIPPPSPSPSPAPVWPPTLPPSVCTSPPPPSPTASPKSSAPENPPVFDAPAPAPSASPAFRGSSGFLFGLYFVVLGWFFGMI